MEDDHLTLFCEDPPKVPRGPTEINDFYDHMQGIKVTTRRTHASTTFRIPN